MFTFAVYGVKYKHEENTHSVENSWLIGIYPDFESALNAAHESGQEGVIEIPFIDGPPKHIMSF